MTTESNKNGAITMPRMNLSGYVANVGHVTVFSLMLTTACCLVVCLGLGLGLDLVSGLLVVTHSFLYYNVLSVVIVTLPQ